MPLRNNPPPPNVTPRGIARMLERQALLLVDAAEDVLSAKHYPPASDAGEVPHRRTGRLATRWRIEPSGNSGIRVVSEAEYSGYLEEGTSRMAARPFAQAVLDRVDVLDSRAAADALENIGEPR